VGQHAAVDDQGTVRVLVVSKSAAELRSGPREVDVCLPAAPARGGAQSGAGSEPTEAELLVLSAPSLGAKFNDSISLAGQTWSRSLDGNPEGQRQAERVAGRAIPGPPPRVCFAFELAPLSAAMLVVRG
jgi:hypothetical protein